MEVLDTLVAVIPMLGILIVAHELGHFLVAKACGVRVLKFSIGFGAPIGFGRFRLRWERGGTEYVIGWIPLGGFVRMLGEPMPGDEEFSSAVPDDAREDEFLERKPVWQKLSVVFAGPAMNLLLPVVCIVGILWNGVERMDAVIGMVEVGSPAAVAGVLAGDRIVSIDGEPVTYFGDAIRPIGERVAGGHVALGLERNGEAFRVEVPVGAQKVRNPYGTFEDIGWIGIGYERLDAQVGVPDFETAAARAGLRTGDRVLAIGGEAVDGWEGLATLHAEMATRSSAPVLWQIEREQRAIPAPTGAAAAEKIVATEPSISATSSTLTNQTPPLTFEIEMPADPQLARLGLVPATILVGSVSDGRPAATAGLARGDLILAVDGVPVGSFRSFVSQIQTSAGRELEIRYAREGRTETTRIRAREEIVAGRYDIEGMEERIYQIGLAPQRSWLSGPVVDQQIRNPIESIPQAFSMTVDLTKGYLEGLSGVFTGDVGADKLAGPIGIARIARKSLDRGFEEYLWMMMLISINLGILNLLPIPILDGGQALIYSIEGIKRSPLSMRARELASSVGFAVLVLLMGRAFWNDLTPFWLKFVDWLSSTPPTP